MRIGIDIDGVLTNIEQFSVDYLSKYCVENNISYNITFSNYNIAKSFNISEDKADEFWKEYFEDYSINVEPRKFASEVIKKLKDDGNEIYIITARGSFLSHSTDVMSIEKNQQIVLQWFQKNNIYYFIFK